MVERASKASLMLITNLSSSTAIRKKAPSVIIIVGFGTHMVDRSTCKNID